MKKLYWDWNYNNFEGLETYRPDLSDIIVPCGGKDSPWWQGLPSFTNGMKSLKEVAKNLAIEKFNKMPERLANEKDHRWEEISPTELKTMKWCPGVTSLFETSFLLKSPADVTIQISKTMDFVVAHSVDRILHITGHPFDQLKSSYNMFRGKFNIKFTLPVVTMNTHGIPYVFMNPTYHANPIWDVIPGVINKQYSKGIPLIVNTLVDVKHLSFDEDGIATISVKKGDPLSYIWYPEKMKLIKSKNKIYSPARAKI